MAQILDTSTNQIHPLRTHHTLGRSADTVDTAITNSLVSRIHAAVEWNGQNWSVRDLSRNGTWVQGKRIPSSAGVSISSGDRLNFGSADSPAWQLLDDDEPRSLLLGMTPGTDNVELQPYLFIPNNDDPQIVVTYSQRRRCWSRQNLDDKQYPHPEYALQHGEVLTCAGQHWRVFLVESENVTEHSPSPDRHLEDFEFIFELSLDEENTGLKLEHERDVVDLGERSHHYLLLHLARQRAAEANQGLDQKSQGWIDNEQLTRDMGVEMSHINILIFRARKQLGQHLEPLLDTENLVERGKGRMRFGCSRLRIYKGQQLAYQLPVTEAEHPDGHGSS